MKANHHKPATYCQVVYRHHERFFQLTQFIVYMNTNRLKGAGCRVLISFPCRMCRLDYLRELLGSGNLLLFPGSYDCARYAT